MPNRGVEVFLFVLCLHAVDNDHKRICPLGAFKPNYPAEVLNVHILLAVVFIISGSGAVIIIGRIEIHVGLCVKHGAVPTLWSRQLGKPVDNDGIMPPCQQRIIEKL